DPSQYLPVKPSSIEHSNCGHATTRFVIHTKECANVILYDEVVYCIADSNYTTIFLSNGSKLLVSKTLKEFESILHLSQFCRIHASYLVNLNYIKRILKNDRFTVELLNKVNLNVSRSRRDELMQKMETL
ncbi:MAG: LytTR family DNA-binding domain-containing protein, partial [Saprospiraceae bacterium]